MLADKPEKGLALMSVIQELKDVTADMLSQRGFSDEETDLLTAFQMFDLTSLTQKSESEVIRRDDHVTAVKQSVEVSGRDKPLVRQHPPLEPHIVVYKDTPTNHNADANSAETPDNGDESLPHTDVAPRKKCSENASRNIPLNQVKTLDFSTSGTVDVQRQPLRNQAMQNSWFARTQSHDHDKKADVKKQSKKPDGKVVKSKRPTKKVLEERREMEMAELKATLKERELALQREQLKNSQLVRNAEKSRAAEITAPVRSGLPKPNIPETSTTAEKQSTQARSHGSENSKRNIFASLRHLKDLNKAQNILMADDDEAEVRPAKSPVQLKRRRKNVMTLASTPPSPKQPSKKPRKTAPPSPITCPVDESMGLIDSPPNHSTQQSDQSHDSPDGSQSQPLESTDFDAHNTQRAGVNNELGESFIADDSLMSLVCGQKTPAKKNLMDMSAYNSQQ